MILEVVKFGHPALRAKGAKVTAVTPETQEFIASLFETMYAHKGVGLAAQQVGVAQQITVIDVRGIKDRPSTLELDGTPADVDSFMPLALVNPELTPAGAPEAGPEGCLSFPEIFAEITRPERVEVRALDRHGHPIAFRCGGLLARAIQHETDHLNGILFIDRMDRKTKESLRDELEDLQAETKANLKLRANRQPA